MASRRLLGTPCRAQSLSSASEEREAVLLSSIQYLQAGHRANVQLKLKTYQIKPWYAPANSMKM